MTSGQRAIRNGPAPRRAWLSGEFPLPHVCPSPCAEGDAFGTREGGGRNATGLARPSKRSTQMPTDELSPMAFLGGGIWGGRGRSPPPDASSALDRPSHMRRGWQWLI